MRFSLLLAAALATTAISAWAGTPAEAARVRQIYDGKVESWVLKLKIAKTNEERQKLAAERPDPVKAGQDMWAAIAPNLAEEWTVEPATWFLRVSAGQPLKTADGKPLVTPAFKAIREAVEKHHLKSKNLIPLCMAAVVANDPNSLPLLQKIEKDCPDKKTQGVAALGTAMLMKNLGDESEVVRKRLTLLRKAIIESSDVQIDGVSVAKLAEDELYIIRFLSKNRDAPELEGVNSGGQPLKLSNYKDKVVVLLFWRSREGAAEQIFEMARLMRERFADKPFEIVGVNSDPVDTLRDYQKSGQIEWPNFSDPENKLGGQYRVAAWPLAYVLDGRRVIHYVGPVGSFVEFTAAALVEEKMK